MKLQFDLEVAFMYILITGYSKPSFSLPAFNAWLSTVEDVPSGQDSRSVQIKCDDDKGSRFHHQCREHVAIFCKEGFAYFKTSEEQEFLGAFVFPEDLIMDPGEEVYTDTFAFCNDLVFFVSQGDLFSFNYQSGIFLKILLNEVVTNVETSCCCVGSVQCDNPIEDLVISWNGHVNSSSLYFHLSQDGGLTFKRRKIKHAEGYIQNTHFIDSHECIGFLVRISSTFAKFFYDSYSQGGMSHLKGLDLRYVGNLSSIAVGAGDSEILLWDDERLQYSANGGQSFLPVYEMSPSGGSMIVYKYSSEERPYQILCDGSDTFVLRNYIGEVFMGKAGIIPSLMKITDLSIPLYSAVSLSSEVNLVVWSLQLDSVSSRSAVLSSDTLYPFEKYLSNCKHQSLIIGQLQPVYYLDIGMTMVLNVSYLPEPWMEDNFIVSVENPEVVSTHTDVTFGRVVDKGIRETMLAINVSLVASSLPNGQRESARGMSSVKVSIVDPNPACMAHTSKTTRIVAGCPSYKEIRVRRTVKVTECEDMKNHLYTIPRDIYDPRYLQGTGSKSDDWGDVEVAYDYWKLGCPHPVYYGFVYKLILELYEHDVFKEVIEADYVLTEAHGLYNYGYTETAETAGCTRSPQSWLSMLTQQSTADPYAAWTSLNYISCQLAEQEEIYDPSQPYEILNNNTANGIKFSQHNGIYVFNITVLNPDYSFCQLRTQYAVEVFGAFPKSDLPALRIMLITCGLGLIALVSFYIIDIFYLRDGEEEQGEPRRDSFPY